MAALFVFINTERQKNEQAGQAEGKSRGGLSTKIHTAVDALGNPIRLLLMEGQGSEYGQACPPHQGVLADKGYDSDAFVEIIRLEGTIPVVSRRRNRIVERFYDKVLHKERNHVEQLCQKLKHF